MRATPIFGAAFGYLEAAVVSYLRLLHEPARQRYYPGRAPGELFPLLTLDQLRASGGEQRQTLAIEIGREAATIVMLGAIALAVSTNAGQWAAAFVVAFGTWDIAFYLFLKLLLGWPASLFTWDVLFLIPVPWVGPVLAPLLVSAAMIAAGIWQLRGEARSEPVRIGAPHWAGLIASALVIVISFAVDYRNIMLGRMPRQFNWGVFALGMTIAVASYGGAVRQSLRSTAPAQRAEAARSR
ncbi:MAG: hypothetical protein P4L56_14540 [Candidatus Sulfopaludibacter sp.]|nr:hypothetical protein [Candidatus Sulfopaludibacter sp.]